MAWPSLPDELFALPHALQEALDAAVVEAGFEFAVAGEGLAPCPALGAAVLGELVQGVRPVVPVDEVEVGVAGVVGDGAPVLRVLHAVDDRAVAAGGFAEAAAVLAAGEGAEFAVDEGDDFAREVVGVVADRGGVDVLVAAQRGEAVGEDDDRRPHFLFVDQARGALGHVVAEGLPVGVREAGAGEADQVVEHRVALAAAVVVARRQPDADFPHMRIAEGIALQDLRVVLEDDEGAGVSEPLPLGRLRLTTLPFLGGIPV